LRKKNLRKAALQKVALQNAALRKAALQNAALRKAGMRKVAIIVIVIPILDAEIVPPAGMYLRQIIPVKAVMPVVIRKGLRKVVNLNPVGVSRRRVALLVSRRDAGITTKEGLQVLNTLEIG
jgi:hypothetical protein